MNFKDKSIVKIQATEQKIQEYQEKYPHRNWKQKHKLNVLWLELIYWQLVTEEKIYLDPLWGIVDALLGAYNYFQVSQQAEQLRRQVEEAERKLY